MISIPIPAGLEDIPEEGAFDITATFESAGGQLTLVALEGVPVTGDEEEEEEMEAAGPPADAGLMEAMESFGG